MIIKVLEHTQDEKNHYINLRVEQESKPFNSINKELTISKLNTINLSVDEVITKAYKSMKREAIKVFSNPNILEALGLTYIEEAETAEGFTLVEPEPFIIEILGTSNISKEIGEEITLQYEGRVYDQYGDIFTSCPVYFASDNIALEDAFINDGLLLIVSDSTKTIKLVANHENLSTELVVNINTFEKELTPDEIRDNYILDLDYRLTKAEMGV